MMDNITLTKDAADVFSAIYKEYRKRVKRGASKSDAADFCSSKTVHSDLLPKWDFDNVDSACAELRNAGLTHGFRADGYEYRVTLSDKGITYGENRAPAAVATVVSRVLEVLQAIRGLLPW